MMGEKRAFLHSWSYSSKANVLLCVYVCVLCVCVCVYIYIYIYTYVYVYARMYIWHPLYAAGGSLHVVPVCVLPVFASHKGAYLCVRDLLLYMHVPKCALTLLAGHTNLTTTYRLNMYPEACRHKQG
jgi:hypothetical protein